MWISRNKYNALVNDKERLAELLKRVMLAFAQDVPVYIMGSMIMPEKKYREMNDTLTSLKNRVKILEADVEFYKKEYGELRNNKSSS